MGCHVYRVYWDPIIGEELDTEPENDGGKYGVTGTVLLSKRDMSPSDIYLKTFLYLPSSSLSMAAEFHARLREEGKDQN